MQQLVAPMCRRACLPLAFGDGGSNHVVFRCDVNPKTFQLPFPPNISFYRGFRFVLLGYETHSSIQAAVTGLLGSIIFRISRQHSTVYDVLVSHISTDAIDVNLEKQ